MNQGTALNNLQFATHRTTTSFFCALWVNLDMELHEVLLEPTSKPADFIPCSFVLKQAYTIGETEALCLYAVFLLCLCL